MFDDRWPDRGQWSFWLVQRRGWPGSFCGNLRSEWLVHGPTLDFRESPAITILHSWIVLTYNDSDVSVMFRAISIHFKSQATSFILYIWCLLVILFFFSWDRLILFRCPLCSPAMWSPGSHWELWASHAKRLGGFHYRWTDDGFGPGE